MIALVYYSFNTKSLRLILKGLGGSDGRPGEQGQQGAPGVPGLIGQSGISGEEVSISVNSSSVKCFAM